MFFGTLSAMMNETSHYPFPTRPSPFISSLSSTFPTKNTEVSFAASIWSNHLAGSCPRWNSKNIHWGTLKRVGVEVVEVAVHVVSTRH
jgi:hypothetical protein